MRSAIRLLLFASLLAIAWTDPMRYIQEEGFLRTIWTAAPDQQSIPINTENLRRSHEMEQLSNLDHNHDDTEHRPHSHSEPIEVTPSSDALQTSGKEGGSTLMSNGDTMDPSAENNRSLTNEDSEITDKSAAINKEKTNPLLSDKRKPSDAFVLTATHPCHPQFALPRVFHFKEIAALQGMSDAEMPKGCGFVQLNTTAELAIAIQLCSPTLDLGDFARALKRKHATLVAPCSYKNALLLLSGANEDLTTSIMQFLAEEHWHNVQDGKNWETVVNRSKKERTTTARSSWTNGMRDMAQQFESDLRRREAEKLSSATILAIGDSTLVEIRMKCLSRESVVYEVSPSEWILRVEDVIRSIPQRNVLRMIILQIPFGAPFLRANLAKNMFNLAVRGLEKLRNITVVLAPATKSIDTTWAEWNDVYSFLHLMSTTNIFVVRNARWGKDVEWTGKLEKVYRDDRRHSLGHKMSYEYARYLLGAEGSRFLKVKQVINNPLDLKKNQTELANQMMDKESGQSTDTGVAQIAGRKRVLN